MDLASISCYHTPRAANGPYAGPSTAWTTLLGSKTEKCVDDVEQIVEHLWWWS